MSGSSVTRGYGLLEGFLSKQRAKIANKLIEGKYRKGNILDIGCGNYPYFLQNTSFCSKYGLDKLVDGSPKEDAFLDINFINHDFEYGDRLPLEDDFFDVVTMLAVFEHIEVSRLVGMLNEIYRVLKVGGVFIMTTPAIWTDKLLRLMARLRLVSAVEIEEHKDAYNFSKITSIFEKTSFSISNLELGYFELFLNIWVRIGK